MKGISRFAAALSLAFSIYGTLARAQEAAPAPAIPVIPEDQQATKEQLARLMDVMRVRQQMTTVTRTMPAVMQQQFQQQFDQMKKDYPQMSSLTDDQQKAMSQTMDRFFQRAMSLYPADEMVTDASEVYQKHLSRPDVEATIVFYSSAAGQHILDMVPAMMQEFMPMVMEKLQARMQPLILEMTKEMAGIATSSEGKSTQK